MITTKVLVGVFDELDVLQRIAVNQQQIGERTLLHHAELAGIGIDVPDSAINSPLSAVAILVLRRACTSGAASRAAHPAGQRRRAG